MSESFGIFAVVYNTSGFKPTTIDFTSKKTKTMKDILTGKVSTINTPVINNFAINIAKVVSPIL